MSGIEPDAATAIMIGCLEAIGPLARPLIVGEGSGRLAAAIERSGGAPTTWLRQATVQGKVAARDWPQADHYDGALVRLPKSKDALEMALHASASLLQPGASIVVFGGNDEGIRSADKRLALVADEVGVVVSRHHARVIIGRRRGDIAGLKRALGDWRQVREIEIDGRLRSWVSYPGTFAKGGLDDGTAFLIANLPAFEPGCRVLDFAAGTGVIAAAILGRVPDAVVGMIEADALGLAAARENAPGARAVPGDRLGAAGREAYDVIISNPPIHDGTAESRAVLDRLITEAPGYLRAGGRLILVVQRRVSVMATLSAALAEPKVIADNGRFTVATAAVRHSGR